MGIAIFLLGILGIAAAIGFAFLYVAAIAMMAMFAAAYLVALFILYALLGEGNIGWAVVLALPASLLCLAALGKLTDK